MKKILVIFVFLFLMMVSVNAQTNRRQNIKTQNISLPAGNSWSWQRYYHRVGSFTVGFTASSDVEVYLLDEENYRAWEKGNAFSYVYFSGRVSNGAFTYNVKGAYRLVVSNKFSYLTRKNVSLSFYD